jgi:hypothetical protein
MHSDSCWAVKWQTITHELPTVFPGAFHSPTGRLTPETQTEANPELFPPDYGAKRRQVRSELTVLVLFMATSTEMSELNRRKKGHCWIDIKYTVSFI